MRSYRVKCQANQRHQVMKALENYGRVLELLPDGSLEMEFTAEDVDKATQILDSMGISYNPTYGSEEE